VPTSGCNAHFTETVDPLDVIQPKDFAFVPGGWTKWGSWTFHLFYTRMNQNNVRQDGDSRNTEKDIGHAVSNNLADWWVVDTAAVHVRTNSFATQHVWAPSIVRRGPTFYMFYAGVDDAQNQSIGFAESTDLLNWEPRDSVLFAGNLGSWADPAPSFYSGHAQLRDPFVMQDSSGDWLMYFATVLAEPYTPEMAIGVARSHGDFESWFETFPLRSTHHSWLNRTTGNGPYVVESPHVFNRSSNWWLLTTVNGDSAWAYSNSSSPIDTLDSGAFWSAPRKLRDLVPQADGNTFNFWHATEYLDISTANDIHYLAAWDDAYQGISYVKMGPASPPALFTPLCPEDSALSVDDAPSVPRTLRLALVGLRPARSRVEMRLELPARAPVHLAVYDVAGRRLRTLVDGEMPAGVTEQSWDGRDGNGVRVGSGVYFISLTTRGIRRSVRVPLIR
jgi:hypothetical protein